MEGDDELVAKFELLMGPRFCKRGNRARMMPNLAMYSWLQWGHAFVSVETKRCGCDRHGRLAASMGPRFCKRGNCLAGGCVAQPGLASMGPRFCKRGNSLMLTVFTPSSGRLQWGHAFVSVETCVLSLVVSPCPALQWGHAFVSVETMRRAATTACAKSGFNGATLL